MDQDCDAFLRDTSREIPFLATAQPLLHLRHADARADAPVGRIIGDLLVLQPSAWAHEGRGERLRFPVEHYHHVGGANHFDLLNHPAIFDQMRRCLGQQRSAAGAASAGSSARSARGPAPAARAARSAAAARDRPAPTRSRPRWR